MHLYKKIAACVLLLLAAASTLAAAPAAGDMAPDDVGVTREGKAVRLSDYRGKAVVLSFWATWCPYCLKELPILHNIQNKVGKDKIQVIAVNTETRDVFRKVSKALAGLEIGMLNDEDGDTQKQFGVSGIPHMVIIGRNGRIVAVHRGYDESLLGDIAANINLALATTP